MITKDKITITKLTHSDQNKHIHPGDAEIIASVKIDRTCYVREDSKSEMHVLEGHLKAYLMLDVYGEIIDELRNLKHLCLMNCQIGVADKVAKGFDAIHDKIYGK